MQSNKGTAAIKQCTGSLLALMNTASGPPGTPNDDPEACPPLYAEGLWIRAFGEAYFERHFKWLLRNDPEFSTDSYGKTAWLYVERVYLMNRAFVELADKEGWKPHPAFK